MIVYFSILAGLLLLTFFAFRPLSDMNALWQPK